MRPDGSYAVADDFGRLWGEAAADYQARLADPRWSPFEQRTLEADTAPALDVELFAPLRQRFGLEPIRTGRAAAIPQPKIFEQGGNIVSVDPLTKQVSLIYESPAKPVKEKAYSAPVAFDILGKPKQSVTATPTEWKNLVDSGAIRPEIATNLPVSFYASKALTPPGTNFMSAVDAGKKAVESVMPKAFMGTPGGTNLIAPAPSQGTIGLPNYPTATNKKTGATAIFKDGKWQTR